MSDHPPKKDPRITATELAWLDQTFDLDGFLTALRTDGVRAALPSLQLRAYPKGSRFITEGEYGSTVFILYQGAVSVKKKKWLGSWKVAQLVPGDFFGEIGFLVHSPRTATVTALEDCLAFSFEPEDFQRLIDENPNAASKIAAAARERIAKLTKP